MNNRRVTEYTNRVNKFPKKFFEGLGVYSDEDWIATDVFPAWTGYAITSPNSWVLLNEEDIDYVRFIDENEDPKYGYVVYTHKDESFFTLAPNQEWNKSMYPIIQEVRYKL